MNNLRPKLTRCPTCHRRGMQRRIMDVAVNNGKTVVSGLAVDVCPHCGEQLYDPPAMRAIEAALAPARRRRRTRAARGTRGLAPS